MSALDEKIVMQNDATSANSGEAPVSKEPSVDAVDIVDLEDKHALRKVTLKLDLRLLPILCMLYFFNFLDQVNIANAYIEGFATDLNMPSNGFNTCLWIFYIPLLFAELPSNVILSSPKIRPNLYIGSIVVILGVISMCQGFTKSYGGLLACRFLMGVCEATLPAAALLILGSYYPKDQIAARYAIFYSAALVGCATGGLLAFAIENLNGVDGYAGWRWIFIIEGIITIGIGILCFLIIPNFPHEAHWLKPREKTIVIARIEADRGMEKHELDGTPWMSLISNGQVWIMTAIYFCTTITAGSIASFSPDILVVMGWTAARAQVMSMPLWFFGVALNLICTYIVGKLNIRWPFVILGLLTSTVGWALNLAQDSHPAVLYFGLFLMAGGCFLQYPILSSWMAGNLRGRQSRAAGLALMYGLGNCANFVTANMFITDQAPSYPVAFGCGVAFTVVGLLLTIVNVFIIKKHNRNIARQRAQGDIGQDDTQEVFTMLL